MSSPTTHELGTLAAEAAEKRNCEIFACAAEPQKVWDGIGAVIRLNVVRGTVLDFTPMLERLEAALLQLIDRNAFQFALRTPELEANIAKLRANVTKAGYAPAPAVVEQTAAGPTEAELDAEIIRDWATLHVSEVRSRCRMPNYKARFDRLMAAGRLGR